MTTADLSTYADVVANAVADAAGPLVLVAQSMGAFTAPIVASRLLASQVDCRTDRFGQPDGADGRRGTRPMVGSHRPEGRPDRVFSANRPDPHATLIRSRTSSTTCPNRYAPRRSASPSRGSPTPHSSGPGRWTHWPDVPTRVIVGSDDRLFPLEFQRRLVRERLGLEVEVMPGGHLMALSRPQELVELLRVDREEDINGH